MFPLRASVRKRLRKTALGITICHSCAPPLECPGSKTVIGTMVQNKVLLYPAAAFYRASALPHVKPCIIVGDLSYDEIIERARKLFPLEDYEEHFIGRPVPLDEGYLMAALVEQGAKFITFVLASDDRAIRVALAWAISANEREPQMPTSETVATAVCKEDFDHDQAYQVLIEAGLIRDDNRIYPL